MKSSQDAVMTDDVFIGEDEALAQLEEDDGTFSLAKIKNQMGFADDEHGTYLGVPDKQGEKTIIIKLSLVL